jgi:putative transposase
MVAAAIRTIFAQPSPAHVRDQLEVIAAMLGRQFPKVEAMLRDAADDVTAFASFPVSHWKKTWSTDENVNLGGGGTAAAAGGWGAAPAATA